MSSRKIAIISDAWHPQVNGVVRTYEHICDELRKMGYEVEVFGPDRFPMILPMPGYKEICLTLFPYRRLAQMLESFGPDHVHVAVEGPLGWAARRWCLKHGRNFTSCYHTHFPMYVAYRADRISSWLAQPMEQLAEKYVRAFHRPAARVLVANEALKVALQHMGFKNDIQIMTRGVRKDVFKPADKSLFQDYAAPVALYVGRVAIEKNLEAFLNMAWQGTRIVVGDGPDAAALKKKYPSTVFTGKKQGVDLARCYQSADVFVFPSRTDTFGMVMIEALACGVPVAGYPVTGPASIITDRRLGALDEDLSKAAHKALEQGNAAFCIEHVSKNYDWTVAATQFLSGFQRLSFTGAEE